MKDEICVSVHLFMVLDGKNKATVRFYENGIYDTHFLLQLVYTSQAYICLFARTNDSVYANVDFFYL